MSDEERRHFENLILLCDECHSIIDNKENEDKYPVALLKLWKKNHESTATYNFLGERPSLLMTVIDAIVDMDFDTSSATPSPSAAFDIDGKIEYNCVKRNRALIEEYKAFYKKINSLYQTLESEGSFKKERLLRSIRYLYLQIKGRYFQASGKGQQDTIRENADSIIEDVQDELLSQIQGRTPKTPQEDVVFGLSVIIVDAFIRCKILEEPPV